MKKPIMFFILVMGLVSTLSAQPMGHFHRSPHHHGHSHHHHTRLNTLEEQKPAH